MSGWIKLYRCLTEWEWYQDTPTKCLFFHCLAKANYEDKTWKGVLVERGSFVTSLEKLSIELGLSIKQIRRAISNLIKTGEITKKGTAFTHITVCNYNKFQGSNDLQGTEKTEKGQRKDTEMATTKEVKKERSKEIKRGSQFTKPTLEELSIYFQEKNSTHSCAEKMFDYFESNGWKVGGRAAMKDWKAASRGWIKREKNYGPKNKVPNRQSLPERQEGEPSKYAGEL